MRQEVGRQAHLVGIRYTSHARHDTENVVVHGIHADLGSLNTGDGVGGEHELEHSVINAREVARTRGLVLLRAEGKGVHVDARIGGTGVVLEGLDNVEVRAFALREAVLTVELELGSDDGVKTPAVHVKGSLGEHEGAGIGHVGARDGCVVEGGVSARAPLLVLRKTGVVINGTGHLEETAGGDESVGSGCLLGSTEGMDGVGEGINGIGVVEGLGTKSAVESG